MGLPHDSDLTQARCALNVVNHDMPVFRDLLRLFAINAAAFSVARHASISLSSFTMVVMTKLFRQSPKFSDSASCLLIVSLEFLTLFRFNINNNQNVRIRSFRTLVKNLPKNVSPRKPTSAPCSPTCLEINLRSQPFDCRSHRVTVQSCDVFQLFDATLTEPIEKPK